jgi:hypothetical protein
MASTIKADTLQSTTSNVFILNSAGTEYARFDSTGGFQLVNPSSFAAGTAALPSITATGDTNTGVYFPAADTIAFTEGGTEVMRINSSAFVGIGITTPTCVLDVVGGIKTSRTAVSTPATTDGNVFSGTYTPTLTNTTNIAASTAHVCQYMRVGNVVTVSGRLTIDPTATATASELGISLPIASAFAEIRQCGGTGAIFSTTNEVSSGGIAADVTNDRAQFRFASGGTASREYSFTFTYLVV